MAKHDTLFWPSVHCLQSHCKPSEDYHFWCKEIINNFQVSSKAERCRNGAKIKADCYDIEK